MTVLFSLIQDDECWCRRHVILKEDDLKWVVEEIQYCYQRNEHSNVLRIREWCDSTCLLYTVNDKVLHGN